MLISLVLKPKPTVDKVTPEIERKRYLGSPVPDDVELFPGGPKITVPRLSHFTDFEGKYFTLDDQILALKEANRETTEELANMYHDYRNHQAGDGTE